MTSRAGRRIRRFGVVACVAVCLVVALAGPAAAAPTYPVSYDIARAVVTGFFQPDVPPPGANNPRCRSTTHPTPVVLVHGTGVNQNSSWQAIAPELANRGYCVYTTTVGYLYGARNVGELDSVTTSATQLATFVQKVRGWTGAEKVDLVGHSQGGTVNLFYLRYDKGYEYVRRVVGLAPANNPPTFYIDLVDLIPGLRALLPKVIPATGQLLSPAAFQALVPRTYPGVEYSNIVSRYDELAVPPTVAFLPAGPNVRNILVQDICPAEHVGHLGMIADPNVTRMLMNELDPENATPVKCGPSGIPF